MLNFLDLPKKSNLIGERIRALREAADWSREDLAGKSGVGTATLARIELGENDPQIGTLKRIASCLGVPLEDLLMEEDGDKPTALLLQEFLAKIARLNQEQLRLLLPTLADTIDDFTAPQTPKSDLIPNPKRSRS